MGLFDVFKKKPKPVEPQVPPTQKPDGGLDLDAPTGIPTATPPITPTPAPTSLEPIAQPVVTAQPIAPVTAPVSADIAAPAPPIASPTAPAATPVTPIAPPIATPAPAPAPEIKATVPETKTPTNPTAPPPPKKGFFARIRDGLKKTTQILNTDIRDLFKAQGRLVDEKFLEELRAIMIKTDMGPVAAGQIVDQIATEYRARVVEMDQLLGSVKAKLRDLLVQTGTDLKINPIGPTIIMVAGVNGSGKTTSIAKLTHMFREQGKTVVLGAGDTFRAAAVAQLEIWAKRTGAEIVTGAQGSDPASVAHRAVDRAITGNFDVCIIDTAGRLQTQQNLMSELTKIHRVIGKRMEGAPHEVLLVLDGTSGQNAISQARGFTEAVKSTGIVLSKIDGTAKGGVVIPIRQQFGLPVKYVGVGEQADDLIPFLPETFVEALFAGLTAV